MEELTLLSKKMKEITFTIRLLPSLHSFDYCYHHCDIIIDLHKLFLISFIEVSGLINHHFPESCISAIFKLKSKVILTIFFSFSITDFYVTFKCLDTKKNLKMVFSLFCISLN